MANRRKEIPSFVSIEVGVARSIAEAMTDDEWGKWSKKALDDLSIGCTRNDTDVRVRNLYEKSKENMDKEYLRKKEWYEKRKEGAANGNNADESTTAFENMRRVPQNEAPAHGFSGGRAAQGTMSRPPEAAAQSGNNFGSALPSTDGGTRKDPLNMETARKNGSLESRTSVENVLGSGKPKSQAQSDQRRAGVMLPSSSLKPPARSGAVDVLNLAYAGEFGNVRLTQEQYSELGIKFGNMQKLNRAIDSLSCKLENEELKPEPKNHYAVLLKWASYREDMEEQKEEENAKPKLSRMEQSWINTFKAIERM